MRNDVDSYFKVCRNDSNPVGPVPIISSSFLSLPSGSAAPPPPRLRPAAERACSPLLCAPCSPTPARAWGLGPRREHALQSASCRRQEVPPLLSSRARSAARPAAAGKSLPCSHALSPSQSRRCCSAAYRSKAIFV